MHGADGPRLLERIHVFIKGVDQPIDGRRAADAVENRGSRLNILWSFGTFKQYARHGPARPFEFAGSDVTP